MYNFTFQKYVLTCWANCEQVTQVEEARRERKMVSSCIFAIKSIFVHFQSCIGFITSIELEDWDIRDISWTAEVQLGPGGLSL